MATFSATVTAAKVAATLTDYPAYIDLSEMPAAFWSTVTNGGGDIRVYSDAGLSTELAREVVSCDTGAETGELHVKIHSLTTSTVIYVDVDGARTEPASDSTYGSENAWPSHYKGVWHMNTVASLLDSTTNDHDGTVTGNPASETVQLGNGWDLDGSGDYGSIPSSADFNSGVDFAFGLWMRYDSSSNTFSRFMSRNVGSTNQFRAHLAISGGTSGIAFRYYDGADRGVETANPVLTQDTLHRVWCVNDNGTPIVYVDGSTVSVNTSVGGSASGGTDLRIGNGSLASSHDFGGDLDEVYFLSGSVPSSDWITTEHNNQDDVATFWTLAEVAAATPTNALAAFGGF